MQLDGSYAPNMLPPSSPTAAASSPMNPYLSPSRTSRRKERRNPSVTPRRFGRFFTPRSSASTGIRIALEPLGASATNHQPLSPRSLASDPLSSDPICPSSPTEELSHGARDKRKRPEHAHAAIKRRRDILNGAAALPPLRLPPRSFHMSRDGDVSVVTTPVEERDGLDYQRRATLVSRLPARCNYGTETFTNRKKSHFFKTSRSGSVTGLDDKSFSAAPSVQPSELRKCLVRSSPSSL